jgi:hypothetical protein
MNRMESLTYFDSSTYNANKSCIATGVMLDEEAHAISSTTHNIVYLLGSVMGA